MQRSKISKSLKLGLVAAALAAAPALQAQVVTTSTLSGSVLSEQGQSIAGAKLTIVHQPTGVTQTILSRADGSFALSGLRPGGPYSVTVESEGIRTIAMENVYLEIDTGATLNLRATPADVTVMEKFEVKSDAMDQLFGSDQAGGSTYVNARQLAQTPGGDRSINSMARLDPRVSYNRDPNDRAISVSGLSNRYNLIQVDGVNASDPFGLNSNNTAAERNVIPLDSLEALAINTAPYNARNAGFVGAQINAITKSGTNDFSGALYYNYRSKNLDIFGLNGVGEELDDTMYSISEYKEQTFGASLGGPILRNKLFFYLSYEKVEEDRVAPRPTANISEVDRLRLEKAATDLGFDIGSATPPSGNKLKDDNILAKLDWQISSQHRASLRYNEVTSSRPTFPNFGDGTQQNNFSYSSSWYAQEVENKSLIGQLISNWSDDFSTEVSLSRSEYHSEPKNSSRQPYVQVRNIPVPNNSNTAWVTFGTENSRHFNILDTTTDTAELFGSYRLGDKHTLSFGTQYENVDIFNAFVQNTLGYYTFNSLDAFVTQAATGGAFGTGNTYTYHRLDPNVNAAAEFEEANLGVFINDRWKPFHNLTLDFGVRLDTAMLPDDVPHNALFEQTFGKPNDTTYDGQATFQPRFNFNWQPDTKLRTTVRGGIGLFYGRAPRVWISNSYSNTGLNYRAYSAGNNASNALPPISSNPDTQPTTGSAIPAQQVALLDPDFELPSRWKANLAVDRELGFWDLKATAELEVSWVKNDIFYQNLNLAKTGVGPDGRDLYWDTAKAVTVSSSGSVTQSGQGTRLVSSAFTNRIIQLSNTDKGSNRSFMLSLERPRKSDGWSYRASYVNTTAREVLFGTSSVAASNWQNRSIFNANEPELATATLEVKDKFLASVAKEFEVFKGYKSTISLFYEGRSGYPYSFTLNGDANGDSVTGNDLLYVPVRGDTSKVRFATFNDELAFWQIVDRFGLKQGQAVKANSQKYPWVNQFDLSFKQEVKLPGWKHRLILGADILNVGNLLNSKWGLIRGSNQFFVKRENVATVNYDGVSKQYVYSRVSSSLANGQFAPSRGRGEPAATRWTVLLTARYEF